MWDLHYKLSIGSPYLTLTADGVTAYHNMISNVTKIRFPFPPFSLPLWICNSWIPELAYYICFLLFKDSLIMLLDKTSDYYRYTYLPLLGSEESLQAKPLQSCMYLQEYTYVFFYK